MKKPLIIIIAASALLFFCEKQQDGSQAEIPAGEVETLQPKSQANDNLMINEIDSAKADSLSALKAKTEEAKKQGDKPKDTKQGDKPKEVKDRPRENNN